MTDSAKIPEDKRFVQIVSELRDSVRYEFAKNRVGPGLILLYTSIEILGVLTRSETVESTKNLGARLFQTWADKYILQDRAFRCNSADMWGYRCGLLHTYMAESDSSRRASNPVKHINHVGGEIAAADDWQRSTDASGYGDTDVWISIVALMNAFVDGCDRFVDDVQADPELAAGVYAHVANLLWQGDLGAPPP